MTVLLQDFLSGNLGTTLAAGASGAQADSSFAGLPAVTGSDTLKLVLDPDGTAGDPEIITITAHTASSTTATISRASEGTTARQHLASTKWVNAVTTTDFNRLGFDGTIAADLTGNVTGNLSGTAGVATVATTVTLTDEGSDTTCFPVFAGAATGNEGLETDASALTYNASNGELSATTFVGALTGTASNATSATTATNLSGGTVAATTLTASGDANFDSGTLFVDVSENRVGIKDTSPSYELDVAGELRATGEIKAEGDLRVGVAGAGDSVIYLHDDNSNTWRIFGWDDSENRFNLNDNTNVTGTLTVSSSISGNSLLLTAGAQVDGTITASSGLEATPGISFTGDTDTGIWRKAADTMYLVAGGNGSAEITATAFGLDLGVGFYAWPGTGTGNDAEWVATSFGNYYLVRNSSLRAEKENIQDPGSELTASMIDDVEPLLWNRIHAPGIPEIGPIAEDMDEVSPYLAAHGFDENGDTFVTGFNKTGWMSLMTLAIKDLRTRLAALEG